MEGFNFCGHFFGGQDLCQPLAERRGEAFVVVTNRYVIQYNSPFRRAVEGISIINEILRFVKYKFLSYDVICLSCDFAIDLREKNMENGLSQPHRGRNVPR